MVIGQQLLSVNGKGAYKGSKDALKMLKVAKPPVLLKLTLPVRTVATWTMHRKSLLKLDAG